MIDGGLVQRVLAPLVASKAGHRSAAARADRNGVGLRQGSGRRSGDNAASKNMILHMLPMQSEKAIVETSTERCLTPSCQR